MRAKEIGAGAHGAGLQRHIEIGVGEPLGGRASRQASRITSISAWAVGSASSRVRLPALATTVSPRDDDRADRHFAARGGGFGLRERERHEIRPLHALSIPIFLLARSKRSCYLAHDPERQIGSDIGSMRQSKSAKRPLRARRRAALQRRKGAKATWTTTTRNSRARRAGRKASGNGGRKRAAASAAAQGGKPSFGAKKPYAPRGDRPIAADGERPKRDFKGGDRPFSKGPRPKASAHAKREGPRKPYRRAATVRLPPRASGRSDADGASRSQGAPRAGWQARRSREGRRQAARRRAERDASADGERDGASTGRSRKRAEASPTRKRDGPTASASRRRPFRARRGTGATARRPSQA